MSKRTQPRARGLHSIAAAAIDDRLRVAHGRGSDHAPLLWFRILGHTPWDGADRPTWASNVTLSHEAGLPVTSVEYALGQLRTAGMLSTPWGIRPGAARLWGRVLVPHIDAPVKVHVPGRSHMADLWRTCRSARKRPITLVTLMVGMHALAAHELGHAPNDWARVPGSLAALRRFVGASRGSTFTERLTVLVELGLVRRGGGLWVAPPEWFH